METDEKQNSSFLAVLQNMHQSRINFGRRRLITILTSVGYLSIHLGKCILIQRQKSPIKPFVYNATASHLNVFGPRFPEA